MLTAGFAEFCRDILMDSEVLGHSDRISLFVIPIGALGLNGIAKTSRDTNMWMAGQLPTPTRFLLMGMRCAFLEPDGSLVPISHPLYWDSTIEVFLSNKLYWQSPIAHVIDPLLLMSTEEWCKLDASRKNLLLRRFSNQVVADPIPADRILVPSFPKDVLSTINFPDIDGVLIEIQQPFVVKINHSGRFPSVRILCVLSGTTVRAIP